MSATTTDARTTTEHGEIECNEDDALGHAAVSSSHLPPLHPPTANPGSIQPAADDEADHEDSVAQWVEGTVVRVKSGAAASTIPLAAWKAIDFVVAPSDLVYEVELDEFTTQRLRLPTSECIASEDERDSGDADSGRVANDLASDLAPGSVATSSREPTTTEGRRRPAVVAVPSSWVMPLNEARAIGLVASTGAQEAQAQDQQAKDGGYSWPWSGVRFW